MRDLTSYLNNYSDDINRTAQEAIKAGAELLKLLFRDRKKPLTVTRQDPQLTESQSATMFKVTNKSPASMVEIKPEEKAKNSLETLNSLLANKQELKAEEINTGTNKYKVAKYKGGGIAIESEDSKIFSKGGRLDISGKNRTQIVNDLPEIVAELETKLGLQPPKKKPEDNYEVLYGFDRQNKFIEKPLSQEDAVAILALMNGTEGTTIANGANLLIEYGNEKLFETDEQGTVIYSAFDRNPELLSSIKLQDKKGLKQLTDYAKRMASRDPAAGVAVNRINSLATPAIEQTAKSGTVITPESPTAQALNERSSIDLTTPKLVDILNQQVLNDVYKDPSIKTRVDIDGVKFDRNPLKNGDYSLYITPENERKGIRLGVVDKDGKFAAAPGLEERKDLKKIVTKILEKQEIDLQSVKQNQPAPKVTSQSVQQNSSPSSKVTPQPVNQNESPTAETETKNQSTSEQSKPSPFPPLNQANAPGANPQQPESTVKIPVSGGTQQPQSKPTVKVPVGGSQQPQPQEQRTR
jgi:hypothetical protein